MDAKTLCKHARSFSLVLKFTMITDKSMLAYYIKKSQKNRSSIRIKQTKGNAFNLWLLSNVA